MSAPAIDAGLKTGLGAATLSLLASTSTLLCCALPALFVALGAGAALAGLVSAAPWLVWLSLHKALTFGTASVLMVAAGALLWRARSLPCPADAQLAAACARVRKASVAIYIAALVLFAIGFGFAFVLPALD
ncbi:MAG: hypothetical protein Q7J29_04830 [Stagnimonas sp.]|nr:hypothetical protein [Stagnimonas sp.]